MSTRVLPAAVGVGVLLFTACGADEDGSGRCDRGFIAAGDSVTGVLDDARCVATHGTDTTWSESWTLSGSANTAYVVRLHRLGAGSGAPWDGGLVASSQGPGDTQQLTTPWGTFGAAHDQPELVLTTGAAQTVDLLVSVNDRASMGPYAMTVQACPVLPLVVPDTIDGVDLTGGCTLLAFRSEDDTVYRVGFVSIQSPLDTTRIVQMFARRTAGDAYIYGAVGGPGANLSCASAPCYRAGYPGGTIIGSGVRFPVPGRYTYMFAIPAGQSATASVEMYLPVFAPSP